MLRQTVYKGILIIFVWLLASPQFYATAQSQNQIPFTPEDKFSLLQSNSTINFASNGSYSDAKLTNDFWTFRDLKLDSQNSTFLGINTSQVPMNLKIRAQNSNVTIWNYLSINYSIPVELLSYTAEGKGNQTVNLGLNASSFSNEEWSVIVADSVFLSQDQNWRLLPDGSVMVWGRTGNITIAHFSFGGDYRNLSFFLQHYVSILTAAAFTVVTFVAAAIRFRAWRKER